MHTTESEEGFFPQINIKATEDKNLVTLRDNYQEWYELAGCPEPSAGMMEQAFRYGLGIGARGMQQTLTTTVQP